MDNIIKTPNTSIIDVMNSINAFSFSLLLDTTFTVEKAIVKVTDKKKVGYIYTNGTWYSGTSKLVIEGISNMIVLELSNLRATIKQKNSQSRRTYFTIEFIE